MFPEQWSEVDDYINAHYLPEDPILEAALQASEAAGLPAINVTPNQGKLLMLLAQMHGAQRILEIGTLGGYSTIWLARALPPDGHLITLEFNALYADVARDNIAAAGFEQRVEVRVGAALNTLPQVANDAQAPFDFFFIDADKGNNTAYVQWALKLSRVGSVIVVDNVVRDGSVLDATSTDPSIMGTRQLHEYIATEQRLSATVLQTVGSKGYDGFMLAIVTS